MNNKLYQISLLLSVDDGAETHYEGEAIGKSEFDALVLFLDSITETEQVEMSSYETIFLNETTEKIGVLGFSSTPHA